MLRVGALHYYIVTGCWLYQYACQLMPTLVCVFIYQQCGDSMYKHVSIIVIPEMATTENPLGKTLNAHVHVYMHSWLTCSLMQ